MTINRKELLEAVTIIANEKNTMITMKYSLASAAICGTSTIIGGVVAGPIGLVVGASVAGFATAIFSKGKFKSIYRVITEDLTESQKNQLSEHLEKFIKDIDVSDLVSLIKFVTFLRGDDALAQVLIKVAIFWLSDSANFSVKST